MLAEVCASSHRPPSTKFERRGFLLRPIMDFRADIHRCSLGFVIFAPTSHMYIRSDAWIFAPTSIDVRWNACLWCPLCFVDLRMDLQRCSLSLVDCYGGLQRSSLLFVNVPQCSLEIFLDPCVDLYRCATKLAWLLCCIFVFCFRICIAIT